MRDIVIPVLIISRFDVDGLPSHSSDTWVSTISKELSLILKCAAVELEKNAYRKTGKKPRKTSHFPEGEIKFGSWTDNDNKVGYVGVYWYMEFQDANFESLLTSLKSVATEFALNLISAFGLLAECAGKETYPGERDFFTNRSKIDFSRDLALAFRKLALRNDFEFEVIDESDKNHKISVNKTRVLPFKRESNLIGILRNIRSNGPLSIKGEIAIGSKYKSISVEYSESTKGDILDILKSGEDWKFEFEVYHEFVNGVENITKLYVVNILESCKIEELFDF
ncbi:hypothetical protein [Zhongshania sp.]|jgi:hypothetical protein|uniref:hypothetical protein n=1 Tax=Zhongshania sp. TaxID=1971902 RepID=UPI002A82E648|nr:hypothetical protein [Zhongshania sp.]